MQSPIEQDEDVIKLHTGFRQPRILDDKFEFEDGNEHYSMNTQPKGVCLIINNKTFNKKSTVNTPQSAPLPDLEVRHGTDVDRDLLKDTFERLGCRIICKDDASSVEMHRLLQDISRMDHSGYSLFVCCLLSHGSYGKVYGSDCVAVELKHLISEVKPNVCPSLTDKPKLFFVQACQGPDTQTGHCRKMAMDTAPTRDDLVPSEADFLLGYCTVPGFRAFRDPLKGSPYIVFLADLINKYSKKYSILDILTKVNNAVAQQYFHVESADNVKQIPAPMFTLRKPLYLDTTNQPTSFESQVSVAGSESSFGSERDVFSDLPALARGIQIDHVKDSVGATLKGVAKNNDDKPSGCNKVCNELQSAKQCQKASGYKISVFTADVLGAGTDANVSLMMYGQGRQTGEIHLTKSETHRNLFEKGNMDVFCITEPTSLGDISKLRVWHDNKGVGADWHLDRVEVQDKTTFKTYVFPCNQWLSRTRGDKKTERELPCAKTTSPPQQEAVSLTTYKITVKTSAGIVGAGTDAGVYITLLGNAKESSELRLKKSETHGNPFEIGQTDVFTFENMQCVGDVEKLRVFHDNRGLGAAWHLASIQVEDVTMMKTFRFTHNQWLSTNDGGKRISCILSCDSDEIVSVVRAETTDYTVKVKTSADILGGGTDANVFLILQGNKGESCKLHLKKSETNGNAFETGQLDQFTFKQIPSVGELESVRVWHDNSGFGAAWHLAYIEVEDLQTKKNVKFHCGQWLSRKDEDNKTERTLVRSNVT